MHNFGGGLVGFIQFRGEVVTGQKGGGGGGGGGGRDIFKIQGGVG